MPILNEREHTNLLTRQLIHYCPEALDGYKLRDMGGDGCTLCSELQLLELLQDELTRKTAQLRVKINQSHSTINRKLPPEILATIFQACVEDPSYYNSFEAADPPASFPPPPFLLGAVCRTWRDIAWSTPRLWSSITIHLDYRPDRHAIQRTLAEEWLGRAGQLPLSIRLVADLHHRGTDIQLLQPLVGLINQYSPRWWNLDLDTPACIFPWFRPVGNRAPMLECLKVNERHHFLNSDSTGSDNPDILDLGDTPSLKYMSTRRISLHKLRVDWGALTHFCGESMSDSEGLEVLRRAPLLEYGSFHTLSGSSDPSEFPSIPIVTQNLRTVALTFPNRNGAFFMDNLTCPALETLSVIGPSSGHLSSFFRRSEFTLKSLSVTFFEEDLKRLSELLREQPSIVELKLGWSGYLNDLLNELTMPEVETDAAPLLPNLETLEFMGIARDFKWEKFVQIFPNMALRDASSAQSKGRLQRPWRNIKTTLIQDEAFSPGRGGLPYIPEYLLSQLQLVIARGIELDLKVTSGVDTVNAKDWIKVSEEWHQVQRETAAAKVSPGFIFAF
ncbi:hypothetical protein BDN70DRAFT_878859 [Pholiota conissans]|uniref:F-box domain-containing protein n=1 Tax=Pholiota conissans TaxID=109636 RepID=A0A9P6CTH2_9AGAR|nr:hypothetical protein BDN70DRAFT_878859 [Pholiota conissans]